MKMLNEWLGEHKFTKISADFIELGDGATTTWDKAKDTDEKNIKFEEAIELVRDFWSPEDVTAIGAKIKAAFPPRVEYLLLIGAPSYHNHDKAEAADFPDLTKTNSEVKREEAAQIEEEKKEIEQDVMLSKINREVDTDEDEGESDEDEKSEEYKHALVEYKHSLKDMNAKKRRVVDAIDKRINETIVMKKVFVEFNLEKSDLLQQFEASL